MYAEQAQGKNSFISWLRLPFQRGYVFGAIIIAALLAFEIFNYSTTDYALADLLGDLKFGPISWATILAIAFCGIDFAGIARLFTPDHSGGGHTEVWYLFGAWLLAATMNAMLTWWGVSLAVLSHETLGNAVVDRGQLLVAVPIFVAILVWLIRVLIIGTFSVAGDRLFNAEAAEAAEFEQEQPERRVPQRAPAPTPAPARPSGRPFNPRPAAAMTARPAEPAAPAYRPAPKTPPQPVDTGSIRPEPSYHPVQAMGMKSNHTGGHKSLNGRSRQ
jgi:hypothetical protein